MSEIEFIDKTGELRSVQEIDEAIKILQTSLVRDFLVLKPELVVVLPIAIDALKGYRGLLMKVAKLRSQEKND